MQEGTKKILKNIAIIVLVPTALVVTYYGAKFVHKKYKEKKAKKQGENKNENTSTKDSNNSDGNNSGSRDVSKINKDGSIDTTGMSKYTISIPFKLQPELFSNGKFFDAISKVNYSFISERVDNDEKNNPSMIKVEIMALPIDLRQLRQISQQINNEITITPTITPIVS